MRSRRGYHSLVRLDDTHILAVGGYYDNVMLGATTSTEIYDEAANTWTPAAPTAVGHANAFAARLQDGRVIVAGGNTDRWEAPLTSVEIYDPATNTWTAAPPLGTPRNRVTGGVMFDGRVIVVSGDAVSGGMSAEEWMPGANAWTPIAAPASRASSASAVVFSGGQYILLAGGDSPAGFVTTGEIYKLNHHPVAVATVVTPAAQVLPGNRAAIDVSAAGSSDADGDRLTYTWTEGSTVLAQTNDPMARATLGLGIGAHTITLTASDHFNESSSATVTATVEDGTSGTADVVRALQEELQQARQRATVCEVAIGTANTAAEIALKIQSGDASFRLPGPTPTVKLGAFVVAALTTPSSCQKSMYRTLGGRK
jgi:hypothetical protein